MKIHYQRYPITSDYALCGLKTDSMVDDHREVTCLKCIAAMSPGEQMWHDKNNVEWITHKGIDRRRAGVKEMLDDMSRAGIAGAIAGTELRINIDREINESHDGFLNRVKRMLLG